MGGLTFWSVHGWADMDHVIMDNSLFSRVKILKNCFLIVGNNFYQILSQMNIDVPTLDNLPEDIRILLDTKEYGKRRPVLNVRLDTFVPPGFLRQIHDLLRRPRTLDRTVGERKHCCASLELFYCGSSL